MRTEMRLETVSEYATDILNGATFPPIVAFYDGADFWLANGYHQVEAGRKDWPRDYPRRDQSTNRTRASRRMNTRQTRRRS
jgi:hypothetical protein